jgi:hypothetical protein
MNKKTIGSKNASDKSVKNICRKTALPYSAGGKIRIVLTVFVEDGPDEETKERRKWCEEYHPNLTFEECSKEAGW